MINITGCFSVTLTSFFSISDRGKIEIVQDDDAEDVHARMFRIVRT